MRKRIPRRRALSGRPRGLLAILVFAAVLLQLGCPVPFESSSLNPSTFGQTVTFTGTATSSGVTPTGTMDFLDGATTLASGVPLDGTGKAVFATSSLAIGSHSMTVHYSGDVNYSPGNSSPLTQVVRAASASFNTVTPCRLIDTRGASGPLGGPSLIAGQDRTFVVTGTCNLPSGASSIVVNVVAVQATSGPGFISVFAGGTPLPNTTTVNYSAGQIRANNAIVALGAGGDLTVHLGQGTGTADLVIDVNGFMQ